MTHVPDDTGSGWLVPLVIDGPPVTAGLGALLAFLNDEPAFVGGFAAALPRSSPGALQLVLLRFL